MTENIKKFLELLENDEAFQKELEQCVEKQQLERRQLAIEYAAKEGFVLTDDDLASMDLSLSEEALEDVAGGSVPIGLGFSAQLAKGTAFRFF